MIKILVINDEKILRKRMKSFLELDGYETFTAENGEEGLEIFLKENPDIALVDIKLPGIAGIEVLRQIKEEEKDTEVIMITGRGGIDTAIEALKKDAFGYLQKPIDYNELEVAIKKALKKQEMQKKLAEHVRNLEEAVEELNRHTQAEEDLRKSEGRHQNLVEFANAKIIAAEQSKDSPG
jgi:DNA-binding NtrC family response regulator